MPGINTVLGIPGTTSSRFKDEPENEAELFMFFCRYIEKFRTKPSFLFFRFTLGKQKSSRKNKIQLKAFLYKSLTPHTFHLALSSTQQEQVSHEQPQPLC